MFRRLLTRQFSTQIDPKHLSKETFLKVVTNDTFVHIGFNKAPPNKPFKFVRETNLGYDLFAGHKIANLSVPHDAIVQKEDNITWNANHIIIHDIAPAEKYHRWHDPDWTRTILKGYHHHTINELMKKYDLPAAPLVDLISRHVWSLEDIWYPTYEICMGVVASNSYFLRYVRPSLQSEEMCLMAVSKLGDALQFATYQTHRVLLEAVKNDGHSLRWIQPSKQTEEICLAAVQRHGSALQFVANQTPEIREMAVLRDPDAIQYVK